MVSGFLNNYDFLSMELYDQAIEYLERALVLGRRDTFHAKNRELLALTYFFCGELDDALEKYKLSASTVLWRVDVPSA